MAKLLEAQDIDPVADEVEEAMSEVDTQAALSRLGKLGSTTSVGDLSDGGYVGSVEITPRQNGKKMSAGRPNARRVWSWNGTEGVIPLGWNTEGTIHNGGRPHLAKRHCLCCGASGFKSPVCPYCVKSNCARCLGSAKRDLVDIPEHCHVRLGRKATVIPNFYLTKDAVPFQERFYGSIDCFLSGCPRRSGAGFKTNEDMRIHASTRHRMEYRAWQESQAASKSDELESMRRRLDALTSGPFVRSRSEGEALQARERMAKVRAARKKDTPVPV